MRSLAEYLLVDADLRRCDLLRKRDADGLRAPHPSAPGEGVQLASVDLVVGTEALRWDLEATALAAAAASADAASGLRPLGQRLSRARAVPAG